MLLNQNSERQGPCDLTTDSSAYHEQKKREGTSEDFMHTPSELIESDILALPGSARKQRPAVF